MAAAGVNRSTARAALAAGLRTKLVTTEACADAVYASREEHFSEIAYASGKIRVVMVASAASERNIAHLGVSTRRVYFSFDVFTFVAFGDGVTTEAQAEDARDLIEKHIADYLADNQATATWDQILVTGATVTQTLVIGGVTFKYEEIPVRARWALG